MPKYKVGDRVHHVKENRTGTIEEVFRFLPGADGTRKKMIWYAVRWDGTSVADAILRKSNSLRKAKVGA